jgi:hypothetical protein
MVIYVTSVENDQWSFHKPYSIFCAAFCNKKYFLVIKIINIT